MFKNVISKVQEEIVGRKKELEIIIACLEARKHILLEGAPGCSKSTILNSIAQNLNLPIFILEGNADLTPAKIIGNFDPALVLERGMKPEFFIKGPLLLAMEEGGLFYVDEFNRMAPDASNTLIRAIEENELVIPRYGIIKAHENFRVVLAQNPYDDIGVGRISRALFDRLIRIQMKYQSPQEEHEIVLQEIDTEINPQLVRVAVQLTRSTRLHPEIKQGASVRGAIDFVTLVSSLSNFSERTKYETLRDAAWAALSGKIWIDPSSEKTAEELIEDLLMQILNSNELFLDNLEDWEFLERKKKMIDDDLTIIVPGQEVSNESSPEGELLAKDLGLDAIEKRSDLLEMVGSILLELQEDARKRVIDWATKLVIQETNELFKNQRKLPRFKSENFKYNQFLDLDLDGTFENLYEDPHNKTDAIKVFNREESGYSSLLIIDSSFSMSGQKLVMAAAAAATICHLFNSKDIAVINFGTNANILKKFDIEMSPETLIEQIFSLKPKGLTNIYKGLKVAVEELGERKQSIYSAILLSDCDVNYGKVPSIIAWKLHGLKIIAISPSVNEFVADLLRKETRGELFYAEKVRDIPKILMKIFN
ncbi:MAG: AAA family ATPase [Candidatus Hodarchaeota archaeon]